MTTLIQKTAALNSLAFRKFDFRKQFNEIKNDLQKEFESRGIYWSASDFAALLEELSPKASRVALGYALDYLRPFSTGMGFRIARLSDTQVEIVIPFKFRNRNDQGGLHEATLLPAALEAAQVFWARHIDGAFQIHLTKQTTIWNQPIREEARLRFEMISSQREFILSQLRESAQTPVELKFQIYGAQNQLMAEMELKIIIKKVLTLNQSSSSKLES